MPDPTNKRELILFSLKSCEAGEGTAYVKEYFFTSLIADGRSILDLGCGNRGGTVALGEVAQTVTGITREKHSFLVDRVEPSPNVTFLAGDSRALPFPDKTWDIVLLFSGESIKGSFDAVLAEVSRVLKDDGIFITTVQAMDSAYGKPGGEGIYPLSEDSPSWRASIERVFPFIVGFSQTGDGSQRYRSIDEKEIVRSLPMKCIPAVLYGRIEHHDKTKKDEGRHDRHTKAQGNSR